MKARMAYGGKASYVDVDADIKDLQKMLDCSGGKMAVPVIVEGDKVTIGFGGESGIGLT
jgi:glutaredoxin 3